VVEVKKIHLVLEYCYYEQIDKGKKTVEYRDLTEYWFHRLFMKKPDTVVFHKGYTSTTMTFKIAKILVFPDYHQIEVWIGERISE